MLQISQALQNVAADREILVLLCFSLTYVIKKICLRARVCLFVVCYKREKSCNSSLHYSCFTTKERLQRKIYAFKCSLLIRSKSLHWLLHNKCNGLCWDPSAAGIVSSIPRFFVTASVIRESTFSHMVDASTFLIVSAAERHRNVSLNNLVICSQSS